MTPTERRAVSREFAQLSDPVVVRVVQFVGLPPHLPDGHAPRVRHQRELPAKKSRLGGAEHGR